MAHLLISAAHKSSGKTTISIGLSAALAGRGLCVQPFKKGPDYIDPMWLSQAAGRGCYNLDFNTQSHAEIAALFARGLAGSDIGIIEGNKGLYDGLDLEGRDSNAALAKLLTAPVILVINTEGITRGVAPLVLGYQKFDANVEIAGVILNNVATARQEGKMRAVLERYTDIAVLGAVGRDRELVVSERHLGLTTPAETGAKDKRIARMRAAVEHGIDIERLQTIAATARPPAAAGIANMVPGQRRQLRIGVARDSAFGFYYLDDLEAIEAEGGEIVFIDMMHQTHLPPLDGLFIGGGFPETQTAKLAKNMSLLADVRHAIEGGLPVYAECGGLMYLTRSISWRGQRHEMVGAIAADTVMHEQAQGRGLVRLQETGNSPWTQFSGAAGAEAFGAHEFHYAGLDNIAPGLTYAYKVVRGHGIDGENDGIVVRNCLANFAHLRSTAGSPWVPRFMAFVGAMADRGNLTIA